MPTHRQPGDSLGLPLLPPMAQAAGRVPRAVMIAGSVYTGTIVEASADGTYKIEVDAPRGTISGAKLALPVLGGLTGFLIKTILPAGTKVAFVWDTTPFIHSVIPSSDQDWLNSGTRSVIWGANPTPGSSKRNDDVPSDLLAGEFEISNGFGVAVAFLTTLCRMTAGGRSAVELCLLNDMLRVVSSQYRHISALGDELIFDHGRPTMERSWSSYRHEVMNKLKAGEPLADMKGDDIDREKAMESRVENIGRHRYLEFVGFVGDFVHRFVCDPVSTLASMSPSLEGSDESSAPGSGKSWHYVGTDGTLLWQSVREIRMEIVTRVPVPHRIVAHEAPDLTIKRDYENLQSEYLKLFPSGGPDGRSVYRAAYQIRLYARWLSRLHAVARFLQLNDEYLVPAEADVPAPDPNNGEKDRKTANPEATTTETYACFSIMRDGSIVLHSGCGCAIVLSDGNVQVSAARHLTLEAAGSINVVAGDSINMRARRSVEIAAETGGITMFARAWLKAVVTKGSLWLRSCVNLVDPETPDPALPKPVIAGEGGKSVAVLVESTGGNIVTRSEMGFAVVVDGAPAANGNPYEDLTYGIVLTTPSNVRLAGRNVISAAAGDILQTAAKAMAVSSPVVYGNVGEISLPGLNFRSGALGVTTLEAGTVSANNMFNGRVGPLTDPLDASADVAQHLNHVGVLDSPVPEVASGADLSGIAALEFATGSSVRESLSPWTSRSDGPSFSFPPTVEYYWDTRFEEAGVEPQTITQQYLTLDQPGDPWDGPGYGNWTMTAYDIPGPRVGLREGFGSGRRLFVSENGEALRTPSAKSAAELASAAAGADWISKSGVAFRYLRRP